jgi:hypothetical protein
LSPVDEHWPARVRGLLEAKYLAGDNPRAQSGFGGDAAYWEIARGVIAEAVDWSGTPSTPAARAAIPWSAWSSGARRACGDEPYGLDILPSMVDLARGYRSARPHRVRRCPTWMPPRRFDPVRTELVSRPSMNEQELLVGHPFDAWSRWAAG